MRTVVISIIAGLVCILNAIPAFAYPDFCDIQGGNTSVSMTLIGKSTVTIDKIKWLMGTFQVENHGPHPIFLEGFREEGHFDIWYPEIEQQYETKEGFWHSHFYNPGTFLGPTDKIEVIPAGKETFMTSIQTDNEMKAVKNNDTGRSRVVYIDLPNHQCIYSDPFILDK